MKYSNIGIVIINFLRPDATIKCIDSLLKQCPDIQIYLGDQDQDSKLEKHYNQPNLHWVQLPHDCGISYSRNLLITQIIAEGCDYFMWADNDFIFDNTFKLQDAVTLLQENKKIGVVGGSVKKNGQMCHYERFMHYDRKRGILTYVPIDLAYVKPKYIKKIEYYDCDITFNFSIAKIEVWKDKRIRWHEKIKVKFEHTTFFLNLQRYSKFNVVYCPSMSVHHVHSGSAEYKEFRFRRTDAYEFSKFFKLKAMYEVSKIAYDFSGKKPVPIKKEIIPNMAKTQCANNNNSLQILNNHGIRPVFLNNSCREIITKASLDVSNLTLGFANKEELEKAKKLTNNEHTYEFWTGSTKDVKSDDVLIKVPFPVVNYLENLYGRDWDTL